MTPSLVQTLNLGPVEDEGLDDFMLALGDGLVDGAAPEIVSLSDQTIWFLALSCHIMSAKHIGRRKWYY